MFNKTANTISTKLLSYLYQLLHPYPHILHRQPHGFFIEYVPHSNCRGRFRFRHQRIYTFSILVSMGTQDNGSKLTVTSQTLQIIHIIIVKGLPKLTKQVTEKGRVSMHFSGRLFSHSKNLPMES